MYKSYYDAKSVKKFLLVLVLLLTSNIAYAAVSVNSVEEFIENRRGTGNGYGGEIIVKGRYKLDLSRPETVISVLGLAVIRDDEWMIEQLFPREYHNLNINDLLDNFAKFSGAKENDFRICSGGAIAESLKGNWYWWPSGNTNEGLCIHGLDRYGRVKILSTVSMNFDQMKKTYTPFVIELKNPGPAKMPRDPFRKQ